MIRCSECGSEIEETANFCSHCGHSISVDMSDQEQDKEFDAPDINSLMEFERKCSEKLSSIGDLNIVLTSRSTKYSEALEKALTDKDLMKFEQSRQNSIRKRLQEAEREILKMRVKEIRRLHKGFTAMARFQISWAAKVFLEDRVNQLEVDRYRLTQKAMLELGMQYAEAVGAIDESLPPKARDLLLDRAFKELTNSVETIRKAGFKVKESLKRSDKDIFK